MDRFAPDVLRNTRVTAYEKNILDRKDFRVDLGEKDLVVTRGMILGYSGDSGIGKEHFHFELRNGDNVNLNPEIRHIGSRRISARVQRGAHGAPGWIRRG